MKKYFISFIALVTIISCTNMKKENSVYEPTPFVRLNHPDWSKNATIYEVNIRQYTPEGTFNAFRAHLPRLKAMGVDILWLMPIHPIGQKNRKGTLGSYYSVNDYYGINPEFGTLDDFKTLVLEIHKLGMHVIIDWVANHTAWDNSLAEKHPDWYTKSLDGNFEPTPWYDWEDVIDLDYQQPELRKYMTEALVYWVKEAGIDGFRCDVAGFIPTDFWENARVELERIKPVFMLAEWEDRDILKSAFDMNYSWSLWNKLKEVTTGGREIGGLVEYLAHDVNTFPGDAYRMVFTDNHDKNSWEGNQYSNFADGLEISIVFTGVVNGMPLVYSGQEAGLDRSLRFFDKDTIVWKDHRNTRIFSTLFNLKHTNKALWNGNRGGKMERITNDNPSHVISFYREKEGDKVLSVFNFSKQPVDVILNTKYITDKYTNVFTNENLQIGEQLKLTISAWAYYVFEKKAINTK